MRRQFEVGDIVRVVFSVEPYRLSNPHRVLVRPHCLNGYRFRLVSAGGFPVYADACRMRLVETVEERVAKELMA